MARSGSLALLAFAFAAVACGSSTVDIPDPGAEGPARGPAAADDDTARAPSDNATPAPPQSGASIPACIGAASCNGAASPTLGAMRPFTHTLSRVIANATAYHRGRDQMVIDGDPQWVLGKFTYSLTDTDLDDEEVDIYVERGCAGTWEKLGTTRTTNAGAHSTVDGVEDDGGRVYFEIPKAKALGPGRHRVRMVVAGDHTSADTVIDVVGKDTPFFVSDVDGTLTDKESAEFPAMLTGTLPAPQPGAADALSALAAKGYRPLYLTARPEWLTGRTREFLAQNGFPPGVIRTTTGLTGANGEAARAFKAGELASLGARGLVPSYAFGNTASDADAYDAARINPVKNRILLKLDDPHGGRRIDAYSAFLPEATALPQTCR
jgi:hypothetical protein